jgi:hypothetical protein
VGAPFGARGDRSQTCVDDGDGPNVNEVEMLGPVDLLNVPRGRLWGEARRSAIYQTRSTALGERRGFERAK